LEISGLKVSSFCFHGFIPRVKSDKSRLFEKMKKTSGVHVFFESPLRIKKTLREAYNLLEGKRVVLVRELTKKFESVYSFKMDENWESHLPEVIKGECVLLIEIEKEESESLNQFKEMAEAFLEKPRKKEMSKLLAKILQMDAKEVYKKLI